MFQFTGHGSRDTGHVSHLPRITLPRIVRPAEAGQTAAEGARHSRGEKCLNVVEASRGGTVARGFVEREESLPALTGSAGGRIVQQVGFCRETQQDRHRNAARACAGGKCRRGIARRHFPALDVPRFVERIVEIVFEDQLCYKQRAFQIGERIAETLRGVHLTKRIEIGGSVFADAHRKAFNTEGTEKGSEEEKNWKKNFSDRDS